LIESGAGAAKRRERKKKKGDDDEKKQQKEKQTHLAFMLQVAALRLRVEFQRFLTALSVRPGSSLAMTVLCVCVCFCFCFARLRLCGESVSVFFLLTSRAVSSSRLMRVPLLRKISSSKTYPTTCSR
jgi:hypothetical protein